MSTPLQRTYRFCMGDGSLTIAVCILIFFVFVLYPMVEVGIVRRFWLDLVFAVFPAMGSLLMARVMRDGRMNVNWIMGAVGSYLLIGIVFKQAYRLLAEAVPGTFATRGTPVDLEAISRKLSYYSLMTLTSTGFGDITPVHPYARSQATMEALAGNRFLAVVVARPVGQEIDWRHEQRDLRRKDAETRETVATD